MMKEKLMQRVEGRESVDLVDSLPARTETDELTAEAVQAEIDQLFDEIGSVLELESDYVNSNTTETRALEGLGNEGTFALKAVHEVMGDRPPATEQDQQEAVKHADALRIYLNQIGRIELLEADEEVDLAKRMEAGLYAGALLRVIDKVGDKPQLDEVRLGRIAGRLHNASTKDKHPVESIDDIAAGIRNSVLKIIALPADERGQRLSDLETLEQDGYAARSKLLEANQRWVVALAKRYMGKTLPFLDLIQEGNTGLIRAAEKFDHVTGNKFSTYATLWIRERIEYAIADKARQIRVPVYLEKQLFKLKKVRTGLSNELGRDPSVHEIADKMNVSEAKVEEMIEADKDVTSLDEAAGIEDQTPMGDLLLDDTPHNTEHELGRFSLRHDLLTALGSVDARDAAVVRARYGFDDDRPLSIKEVGKRFKISLVSVREIESRVLDHLRNLDGFEQLAELL